MDLLDDAIEALDGVAPDNVKQRAMGVLERAFDEAEDEGLPPDAIAHAALFAAITTLVDCFGEECVAKLVSELPERITTGSYTVTRTLQ